jgi:RHS repeat-associated protein
VVWRWKLNQQTATGSNAFGAQPAEEDPDGNGTRLRFDLRFPGQQYDAATGLHYNYFRDYESGTGRYVESDPIGLEGGNATYNYVDGIPLVGIDPLGLATTYDNWCRQNPKSCAGAFGGSRRPPIPVPLPIPSSENTCKSCYTEFPTFDLCWDIEYWYPFRTQAEALAQFPRGSSVRNNTNATDMKNCANPGNHLIVINGGYIGSIFSCKCCSNTDGGPKINTRWSHNRDL